MTTPRVTPLAGALITACAGYGAMNAFWAVHNPGELRGLYSYWTATIGDGLILPIFSYLLLHLDQSQYPCPADARATTIASAAAGIGSIAIQAAWLLANDPELNWTLLQPHTFNAAGWYHAAFTVAAGTILGGLWGKALARYGYTPTHMARRLLTYVMPGLVCGFGILLLHDNLAKPTGLASASSLAACTVVAALAGTAPHLVRHSIERPTPNTEDHSRSATHLLLDK